MAITRWLKKPLESISNTSDREKSILYLGYGALLIALYFFIIEPLDEKTQYLEKRGQKSLAQLQAMQRLVKALETDGSESATAEQLLKDVNQSIESKQGSLTVIKTQPMPAARAKALFYQLAGQGKVSLSATQKTTGQTGQPPQLEIRFWQK